MWKFILHRVLVPILFVLVGGCVALTLTLKEERSAIARMQPEVKKEEPPKAKPINISISSYDAIFKEVAAKYKLDWVLLAALAKTESGFKHDAVSRSGAVGLMQIMPAVGKSLGYTREQLFDAHTSVELAAKVLHKNIDMLRLPEDISKEEQWSFTLACYNAGYGRIADARALTRHYGLDANKWSDVATYLRKLSEPEYARHEVVKSGYFRGSKETIGHVSKVLKIYDKYTGNEADE
jgi:membrane-bound lytic murein transglycosylase F